MSLGRRGEWFDPSLCGVKQILFPIRNHIPKLKASIPGGSRGDSSEHGQSDSVNVLNLMSIYHSTADR